MVLPGIRNPGASVRGAHPVPSSFGKRGWAGAEEPDCGWKENERGAESASYNLVYTEAFSAPFDYISFETTGGFRRVIVNLRPANLPLVGRAIAYGLSVDARLKAEHDEGLWVSA